ncbi:FAD-dependent oxidoreductase [Iamia majanohamensis]|uniref:FAD-dependent oxidoreductase n=1 Tax=Iamia majanohamensis TaxID=467976 RepID=A0AAE9YF06_9ACTN|nr:FAD-dependent oxidoreductase [Iamia majanohamensis]WCO66641.1 FAD-dependent oxidoreductase [Iamia majanohamensis]
MAPTELPRRPVPDAPVDVAVLGGGLAGLAAAATAARAGASVALVEPHPLGGRARADVVDGFTLNRGPRALYLDGEGAAVLDALGVPWRSGGPPRLDGGLALRAGRTHTFPTGPGSLLRTGLLSGAERLRAAALLARLSRPDRRGRDRDLVGRTVGSWLEEVAPSPALADLLAAVVRLTTYVEAPAELDAHAAVTQVRRGLGAGVRYLDGGWQSLVDALAGIVATAGGVQVASRATAVHEDDGGVEVETAEGTVRARAAVVALGSPGAAAALLGGRPEGWPTEDRPATAACLELGLRRDPAHPFLLGADEPVYLSTHAPPARLAPPGGAVVHLLRYHGPDEDQSAADQRARLRQVAAEAGIGDDDVVVARFQARMVVTAALPRAGSGGLAGRPPVAVPGRPRTALAGDWVGPAGMLADAALASGAAAGRRAAAPLARLVAP